MAFIFCNDTARIEESTLGQRKRYLMFGLVFSVFILIPFKANFLHLKIVLQRVLESNIIIWAFIWFACPPFLPKLVLPGKVATWQDDLGRLNDLLSCLKYTIKKSGKASEVIFKMDVMNNDRDPRKTITLKATCWPGDSLEPVITVMFPDED